ncbi:hypothetical protein LMG28138_04019 [Pararobbsia alpina]|uniref:Uncharacterized protein n=1 Tax=Pararobbsia alpina TaxID=621374 RepID=A0A6S7BDX4_9BURK|nr:hypothetical protein LMG28138_04019 [Pararobbsia alpina]
MRVKLRKLQRTVKTANTIPGMLQARPKWLKPMTKRAATALTGASYAANPTGYSLRCNVREARASVINQPTMTDRVAMPGPT